MTDETWKRKVEVRISGKGAYRLRLISQDRPDAITRILIGDQIADVSLLPGRYTALVESLSSAGHNEPFSFDVEKDDSFSVLPQIVELHENPDEARSSQPRRAVRPLEFKMLRGITQSTLDSNSSPMRSTEPDLTTRGICVGVSCDAVPSANGEWRSASLNIEASTDTESRWRSSHRQPLLGMAVQSEMAADGGGRGACCAASAPAHVRWRDANNAASHQ